MHIVDQNAWQDLFRGFAPPTRRRWATIATALMLSTLLWSTQPAEITKPTEYDVEAAYLFNFGKFITWPQQDDSSRPTFQICVLGDDPFGMSLDRTTAGETINGKKVVDRHLERAQEAQGCSILYISGSESERLTRILGAMKYLPVLTVSDMPGFVERGGMIQFVLQNGRVRFAVNLSPTQQHGLALSSELLKVAVKVTPGNSQEAR